MPAELAVPEPTASPAARLRARSLSPPGPLSALEIPTAIAAPATLGFGSMFAGMAATNPALGSALVMTGFFSLIIGIPLSYRLQLRLNARVSQLLRLHRYDAAVALAERRARWAFGRAERASAVLDWGLIAYFRGDYADARALLGRFIDAGWSEQQNFRERSLMAHVYLANSCTILGELDEARHRLQARQRTTAAARVLWAIADGLYLARSQDWPALVRHVEGIRSSFADPDPSARLSFALLTAFALSELAREGRYRSEDVAGRVDELLAHCPPGSFDAPARHWPRLRSFLAERKLLRDPSLSAP